MLCLGSLSIHTVALCRQMPRSALPSSGMDRCLSGSRIRKGAVDHPGPVWWHLRPAQQTEGPQCPASPMAMTGPVAQATHLPKIYVEKSVPCDPELLSPQPTVWSQASPDTPSPCLGLSCVL